MLFPLPPHILLICVQLKEVNNSNNTYISKYRKWWGVGGSVFLFNKIMILLINIYFQVDFKKVLLILQSIRLELFTIKQDSI